MAEYIGKRDQFIFGVLLPIVVMAVGLLIVMSTETRAGAAEVAALGIFLGAITVAPIVLFVNLLTAFRPADSPMACFKRGMIAPGIVIIGAILYQAGLLDWIG